MKKRTKKKISHRKNNSHTSSSIKEICIRYSILLFLAIFSLPVIYKIFKPLTIFPVYYLLKLSYNIQLINDYLIIGDTIIQIIPACIAGSAYLLLIILNLSVPMKTKKRVHTLTFSILLLLIINILRIFFFALLYHNNFRYFNITHKITWYFLSIVFVIAIWFATIAIFKIKEIPFYTDVKYLSKNRSNK
ncbi:pacearchaeosortase [Candidatus Pacearchaeota archaeon]|nr:pacearchaeosortase [Candidatus Pacearchaeota archaeon]